MTSYRIVSTIGGVNLVETFDDGRDTITRKFPDEERAKAWLMKRLGLTNIADLAERLGEGPQRDAK
jgi:hypothetical protein